MTTQKIICKCGREIEIPEDKMRWINIGKQQMIIQITNYLNTLSDTLDDKQ